MRRAAVVLCFLATIAAPAVAGAARTIAIAYFDNNTGFAELEPLRKGLADMLITDLGQVASLQIVERDKLNQVLDELKLSRSKFIDPRTAQKLGRGLAAAYIMTGAYVVSGENLRVDVRVVEVKTGRVAASDKVEGKKDDFFALEKDLVDLLIKTLDVKLSSSERGKLRANATQSFDAWSKYSAGLDARDRGDEAEARRLFQAALDADPNYQAARSATERLRVIFKRDEAAKAAEIDKTFGSLDPRAADFAKKVDDLLSQLQASDTKELGQKVALLHYLAENDLTPSMSGFARVPLEVMSLVWRFDDAPDAETLLPPVCEYLIGRYPGDGNSKTQCKLLLQSIERHTKEDPAARKKQFEARWQGVTLDWEVALKENMGNIFKLFRLYGQKSRPR